jgi:phosphoribosylformylglycinamidine synthase
VGGIVRDIFTMGARPIALLDSLRFGPIENERVRQLLSGVVAGIGTYGNCIGVPTVAGETYFHPTYEGNPLVNAMCAGLIDQRDLAKGTASGIGNPVMVVGARTGRDGIHGATFASEELSEASEERRPAVQVGDPFMEKLLIESCLEIIKKGYVVGMQDMGAAGLTSSSCEMASRAGTGIEIDVSLVPSREAGMTPYEFMLSESQERMLLVPRPGCEEPVREIFERWGLNAVVVGRVTADGMLRVKEGEQVVAEIPANYLTDECPVYHRPDREPAYFAEVQNFDMSKLPEPTDYNQVLRQLISSPNIASKEWIYRQYDHMVGLNTVVLPGAADAAVLRLKEVKPKGLALTTDCNSRFCYLDPFRGGALAVAEAARNLSCTGAQPLAVTDCLNYGNPEKPEIFWQMRQSIMGMSAACRALDTPVVGGNVSLYNENRGRAIYPTPVVGMVGLLNNVERHCTQGFKEEGDVVLLLGPWPDEIGGSEYLSVVHGLETGPVPWLDLNLERAVQQVCRDLIQQGLVESAHDLSEGGLAVALAECCISGGIGADIGLDLYNAAVWTAARETEPELGIEEAEFKRLAAPADPVRMTDRKRGDVVLFGEGPSRIVISVKQERLDTVQQFVRAAGVPLSVLGVVGGTHLKIWGPQDEPINLAVAELTRCWEEAIPKWLNQKS